MNPAEFRASENGKVILAPEGYYVFIPAPLPPKFACDAEPALALSRADAALSELSGPGRLLPNPRLLIAPYVRREAVLSSRIEGCAQSFRKPQIQVNAMSPSTFDIAMAAIGSGRCFPHEDSSLPFPPPPRTVLDPQAAGPRLHDA